MKNRKENYEERQLQLTSEEIETVEAFKNLSEEQKQELTSLIYELSHALYHLYASESKSE